jgi:hypothetical protein
MALRDCILGAGSRMPELLKLLLTKGKIDNKLPALCRIPELDSELARLLVESSQYQQVMVDLGKQRVVARQIARESDEKVASVLVSAVVEVVEAYWALEPDRASRIARDDSRVLSTLSRCGISPSFDFPIKVTSVDEVMACRGDIRDIDYGFISNIQQVAELIRLGRVGSLGKFLDRVQVDRRDFIWSMFDADAKKDLIYSFFHLGGLRLVDLLEDPRSTMVISDTELLSYLMGITLDVDTIRLLYLNGQLGLLRNCPSFTKEVIDSCVLLLPAAILDELDHHLTSKQAKKLHASRCDAAISRGDTATFIRYISASHILTQYRVSPPILKFIVVNKPGMIQNFVQVSDHSIANFMLNSRLSNFIVPVRELARDLTWMLCNGHQLSLKKLAGADLQKRGITDGLTRIVAFCVLANQTKGKQWDIVHFQELLNGNTEILAEENQRVREECAVLLTGRSDCILEARLAVISGLLV